MTVILDALQHMTSGDAYPLNSNQIQARPVLGYVLALTATVIWSGNFIVARILADSVPPVTLAFLRWGTAVIVLLPFGLGPVWRDRHIIKEHIAFLSLAAFLVVTVFNTLIYIAAHTSNAMNLSLIAVSSPIFIVLFARVFLKEHLTLRKVAGLLAATTGVVLLVTKGDLAKLLALTFSVGDVWMVLAAAIFGAYSVLARVKPVALSQLAFLCATFVLGLVFMVPWVAWEWSNVHVIGFSSSAIAAIVYLGVGPSLVAFLCWNEAIALIGPVRSAFIYYSLPLFSGAEALVLLSEPVQLVHVVSGILILLGVTVATREPAR